MKHSTNLKAALKNSILKIAFCSQVLIISGAIPFLYYVGVTTNNEATPQKHLRVITNKGKKALAADERTGSEGTINFPGFLHI